MMCRVRHLDEARGCIGRQEWRLCAAKDGAEALAREREQGTHVEDGEEGAVAWRGGVRGQGERRHGGRPHDPTKRVHHDKQVCTC